MRYKNIVIIIVSTCILVATGLGVTIIYSDYIYNPNGTLTSIQVVSMNELESGIDAETISETNAQLFQSLEEWARDEQATVLFKNGIQAGCGFCGYSDWASMVLGIEDYENNTDEVYLVDNPALWAAYTSGNMFLPESVGLKIRGKYNESGLPPILRNVDFLYPLSLAISANGNYFTDAEDVGRLTMLFEEYGYSVVYIRQTDSLSFEQLLIRLLSDGFLSQTLLFAMAGLVFCFVYLVLWAYRSNTRKILIHHMLGLSRKRILVEVLVAILAINMISMFLLVLILANGFAYMERYDLYRIFSSALALNVALSICANGGGYFYLLWKFRLQGGL